jgi:arabinogalactan endo-1,4-beta-galactosidase
MRRWVVPIQAEGGGDGGGWGDPREAIHVRKESPTHGMTRFASWGCA